MGCGCGGSRRDAPKAGKPTTGPGSAGYYWSGPKQWNGPQPKQAQPPPEKS